MPVFAVEYTYDTRDDVRDTVRPDHRAFLRALLDSDRLLASGPFAGGGGALLLVVAQDATAARELLGADPFAQHGLVAEARVREWAPVIGPFADRV